MSDDTPTESFTPGESGDLPTRRERRAAEEAAAEAAKQAESASTGEQPTTQFPMPAQADTDVPSADEDDTLGTDIFDFGPGDADGDASTANEIPDGPDAEQAGAPGDGPSPMTELFTPPSLREPRDEPSLAEPITDAGLSPDDASTANEIPDDRATLAPTDTSRSDDDGPATELFAFPGVTPPVEPVTERYERPADPWPARSPADDQATRRFDQQPAAFPGADVFDPLFPAGTQAAQPTQVTEVTRRGTPPTDPPQSKRTLVILIVVGAVLLAAILVLVILLLTRTIGGGTAASPSPSVTKSASPSPSPSTTPSASPSVTPSPSPSPTQTTPPAPTNPTFAAFSAQSSAGCTADSGEVALTFTWGSTDAKTAYIGVGTTNAKQDPFASNLPPTDTYTDLTYDCTQASQVYTVTLENEAGLITNRTVTITR